MLNKNSTNFDLTSALCNVVFSAIKRFCIVFLASFHALGVKAINLFKVVCEQINSRYNTFQLKKNKPL